MVRIALVEAHTGQDIRQHHAEDIRVLQQHRRGVLPAQQLIQLRIHTLVRDGAQAVPPLPRGARRVFLDRKAQHGGKAQQAQNAERILGKALGVRGDDPAAAARSYGKLQAWLYPTLGVLDHFFFLEFDQLRVLPDFGSAQPTVQDKVSFRVSAQALFIVIAAVRVLYEFWCKKVLDIFI